LVYSTGSPSFKPPAPVAPAVHGVKGEPVAITVAGQITVVVEDALEIE
jgi:hypothetical protein